jgi:hypothetical protein
MTKTSNIELESTPVEKNPNNKKLAISSSAIVATGTLFGSAFVPLMGVAAPIEDRCRFSELEIDFLRTELQNTLTVPRFDNTLTACRDIELYWDTPPSLEDPESSGFVERLWDIGEGLHIPFGKSLRLYSNDAVTFISDKSSPFILHGIGDEVFYDGGYVVGDSGYRYENIGSLEIDGIGFYSFEPVFAAIASNQNIIVKNSSILGLFAFGIMGHDITVNNTTIGLEGLYGDFGFSLAAVYSIPGISQDVSRNVDRSDILSGSVQLTYNTFLNRSQYDVAGLGMALTAEGNIFGSLTGDPSEDVNRVHVFNVDLETAEAFETIGSLWGPEFEDFTQTTSSTYRTDVEFEPLPTEWFIDSYNIFSSVPGVLETNSGDVTRTADRTSREGVLFEESDFVQIDFLDLFFGGANNSYSLTTLGPSPTSPAARFVTNPLFTQTQDARRQTRTIPYSAGAVEQNGRASSRSSSAFVFGSEQYDVSPARLAGSTGRNVTILAPSLPEITEVRVGGKKVKIVSSNGDKLVFIAPKGLRGAQDILLKSNSSEQLLEDKIFFTNSKSIRGFADSSAALSPLMKSQIRTFLKQNPHATSITCQGYASLPANPRDKVFGTKRGKAVCAYVASLRPNMKVTVLSPAVEKKSGPAIRRTVLKVIG